MKKLKIDTTFQLEFAGDQGRPVKINQSYGQLMLDAAKAPPEQGFGYEEAELRTPIIKKLRETIDKKQSHIEMDDVYIDRLCELGLKQRFIIYDDNFVEYWKYLKSVKESEGK